MLAGKWPNPRERIKHTRAFWVWVSGMITRKVFYAQVQAPEELQLPIFYERDVPANKRDAANAWEAEDVHEHVLRHSAKAR